jgi:hypothetical protein
MCVVKYKLFSSSARTSTPKSQMAEQVQEAVPEGAPTSSSYSVLSSSLLKLDARTDGISSLHYNPQGTALLVTSWDGGATIYSTLRNDNNEFSSQSLRHAHAGEFFFSLKTNKLTKNNSCRLVRYI